MNKLQKEIQIISALIGGEVVVVTSNGSRYKLHDNKILFASDNKYTWTESTGFHAISDLIRLDLEIEKQPQPKFKLGQEVWFMIHNKTTLGRINNISDDNLIYLCKFGNDMSVFKDDYEVFATKQELLDSL